MAIGQAKTSDAATTVPMREMRGVWVATVANIDWPSKRTLTSEEQKAELIAILDKCVELNLNVVVLQVRPACDALYASKLEPWSEFLTGEMGKAPEPFYDPLAFAVAESHKRGLELHAWFNPYRAFHPSAKGPISADHISKTHPEVVKQYGKHLWLDPGEKLVQKHSHDVIMDVVKRYDLDGIHMDDYFYPYKEKDTSGTIIDFPDEPSWNKYKAEGGELERNDWRRKNVDDFVEKLYADIKRTKPHVKFGLSPFGIWKPGYPEQIKGFNQYEELYADAKKWLNEGWVDYWTPQLYWKIEQTSQSYPVLLKWWTEENTEGRNVWPGNFTSKVAEGWDPEEIVNQVLATRNQEGASGNVHFSMRSLMKNSSGINDALMKDVYGKQALVPASPWLDDEPPPAPKVQRQDNRLTFKASEGEAPFLWVVYFDSKDYRILPASTTSFEMDEGMTEAASIRVSAVDRNGNESPKAKVTKSAAAEPKPRRVEQ